MKKILLTGFTCLLIALLLSVGLMIPEIPDRIAIFEGHSTPAGALYTFAPAVGASAVGSAQTYEAKLFGVIPIKTVSVDVLPETKLVPCGRAFGVKLFTQGVMVVGISEIETTEGFIGPASQAGIKTGDIILSSGGADINTIEQLTEIIGAAAGGETELQINRDGETLAVRIRPVKASLDGAYKVGMWVRDSTAGIGTITFCDPATGLFAGLGHGIFDVDTGALMPLKSGVIVPADIVDVRRGEKGAPGELRGTFDDDACGSLLGNSHVGIYGTIDGVMLSDMKPIPAASYNDVSEGRATILANIDGDRVEEFQIEIIKIYKNSGYSVKNMIIRVTDQRLIDCTGGIVQGMSGSPIIQNGKLVGAVTHVLVNDPTKGYAIFVENMLAEMKSPTQ